MGRLIAAPAHGVKDVGDLTWQNLLGRETPQKIMGRLTGCGIIDARECGDLLDHVFAELAALDQRRIGIIGKEALGEQTEAMEFKTDLLQMTEICRQCPPGCFS